MGMSFKSPVQWGIQVSVYENQTEKGKDFSFGIKGQYKNKDGQYVDKKFFYLSEAHAIREQLDRAIKYVEDQMSPARSFETKGNYSNGTIEPAQKQLVSVTDSGVGFEDDEIPF